MFPQQIRATFNFKTKVPDCFHAVKLRLRTAVRGMARAAPRQTSSGAKERLGHITKRGDKYLRQLLIVGVTALVRYAKEKPDRVDPRFVSMLARKPARVASVAIANKMARIAWAVMARGGVFERGRAPMLPAA